MQQVLLVIDVRLKWRLPGNTAPEKGTSESLPVVHKTFMGNGVRHVGVH